MGSRTRELILAAAVCGGALWALYPPVNRMLVLDPAMYAAVKQIDVQAVRRLALQGAGVNVWAESDFSVGPRSPLLVAVTRGDVDTTTLLIRRGAEVNAGAPHGITPLMQAAATGRPALVRALLEAGADAKARNESGCTALHLAANSSNWAGDADYAAVTRLLLKHGADPHAVYRHFTALALAEETGNAELAAVLRPTGCANRERCLDRIAEKGPLFAVRSESLDAVKRLVRKGVSFRVRDTEGTTVTAAAEDWSGQMLPYLLKHARGIDRAFLNERSRDGNALTVAAMGFMRENIRVLVAAGVDPNVPRGDGYTPLHSVAGGGSTEMVSLLLKAGADLHAKDDRGRTPLDMARAHGHPNVVVQLQKAGAR